jgi:hypothetical protein
MFYFKNTTCFGLKINIIELYKNVKYINKLVDRDISVVIATGYGLDGPGIESR